MKIFLLLVLVVGYLYCSAIYKAFNLCINDSINQSTNRITHHINHKISHKINQIVEGK